jgi:Tol biopolymer transport system component
VRILDFGPERQRIVFTRPASGLYVSGLDGKDSELILRLAGPTVEDAAWSPDGTRLAFTLYGKLRQDPATCGISIWTMRIDRRDLRKIADCAALNMNPTLAPSPWSRDGRRLAYLGRLDGTARTSGVLTVASLADSQTVEIGGVAPIRDIAMAPRGDWVAFDQLRGPVLQLSLVRLRDDAVFSLGRGAAPAWSRDGRLLSFSSSDSGRRRTGMIAILSVGDRPATPSWLRRVRGGGLATWSPSGRAIAYVGFACRNLTASCENDPQVYLVGVKTGRPRRVTNEHDWGVIGFWRIWWGPNDSTLFFTRSRSGV